VINENISLYSPKVVTRIDELTQFFVSKGSDIVTAKNQALLMIGSSVRREAFVMAFNDCFMIVGLALFASGVTILFLKKAKPSGKPSVDAH
jgi:DHA2 family multidrug resistance protein